MWVGGAACVAPDGCLRTLAKLFAEVCLGQGDAQHRHHPVARAAIARAACHAATSRVASARGARTRAYLRDAIASVGGDALLRGLVA